MAQKRGSSDSQSGANEILSKHNANISRLAAAFGISENVLTTNKKQRLDNDVKVLYSNLKSIDSD
jgi:hypothetical protein